MSDPVAHFTACVTSKADSAVLQAVRDRLGEPVNCGERLLDRMSCHEYPSHTEYLLDGKPLIAVHKPVFVVEGRTLKASFGVRRLSPELDSKPVQVEG